jgi:hypothetical protein
VIASVAILPGIKLSKPSRAHENFALRKNKSVKPVKKSPCFGAFLFTAALFVSARPLQFEQIYSDCIAPLENTLPGRPP